MALSKFSYVGPGEKTVDLKRYLKKTLHVPVCFGQLFKIGMQ